MKYTIGYQLPDEYFSMRELCGKYNEQISNVYFSYSCEPSGRFTLAGKTEEETAQIAACQLEELRDIKRMGKKLTLLYNANCYGEEAVSVKLQNHILQLTAFLKSELDIDAITTTSPFIAQTIKREFGSSIQITASVNMRIGSQNAMEQLADCFDGYYLKKEYNRDFSKIQELKNWCDQNGKILHILANSGCIHDCAFQTFHDNLIAHGVGENGIENADGGFAAPCHRYLASLGVEKGITKFMQSNFIRPEEIYLYEPYFSEVKLATRMHVRPQMVLAAYIRGSFKGNLLDLTEPSYSSLFRGYLLDNTKIDPRWAATAYACRKNCDECNRCGRAVKEAVYRMNII